MEVDDRGVPKRFSFSGRTVKVQALIDHWPGSDHEYFKVEDDASSTYIIRHSLESGGWEVVAYIAHDMPDELNTLFPGRGAAEA